MGLGPACTGSAELDLDEPVAFAQRPGAQVEAGLQLQRLFPADVGSAADHGGGGAGSAPARRRRASSTSASVRGCTGHRRSGPGRRSGAAGPSPAPRRRSAPAASLAFPVGTLAPGPRGPCPALDEGASHTWTSPRRIGRLGSQNGVASGATLVTRAQQHPVAGRHARTARIRRRIAHPRSEGGAFR